MPRLSFCCLLNACGSSAYSSGIPTSLQSANGWARDIQDAYLEARVPAIVVLPAATLLQDPSGKITVCFSFTGQKWPRVDPQNWEGNGNPLQYSHLEYPRDSRAWWTAICGVTRSQTWLKWLSISSCLWWSKKSLLCLSKIHPSLHFSEDEYLQDILSSLWAT